MTAMSTPLPASALYSRRTPSRTNPAPCAAWIAGCVVGLGQQLHARQPARRRAATRRPAAARGAPARGRGPGAPARSPSSARAWSQSTLWTLICPRQVSEPGSRIGERGAFAGRARRPARARPGCRARRRSAAGPRRCAGAGWGRPDRRSGSPGCRARRSRGARRRRRSAGRPDGGRSACRTLTVPCRAVEEVAIPGPPLGARPAGPGDGRRRARGRGRAAAPRARARGGGRRSASCGRGSSGGWRAGRRARRGRRPRRHGPVPGADAALVSDSPGRSRVAPARRRAARAGRRGAGAGARALVPAGGAGRDRAPAGRAPARWPARRTRG